MRDSSTSNLGQRRGKSSFQRRVAKTTDKEGGPIQSGSGQGAYGVIHGKEQATYLPVDWMWMPYPGPSMDTRIAGLVR